MPPQQPRRILEKSRTVRRRYQRSNKRFEFSASQIQRIEREEEREKKAKQLREREKKKLANQKKKAEKETKEREERRRLGIPDPTSCKIPASQPLLVNFFGAGKRNGDEVKEQPEADTEDSAATQESEASEEQELIEVTEDDRKQESISPLQKEEPDVMMHQQEAQQSDKTDDTAKCTSEEFSDLATELGDDWLDDVDLEQHMASIENSQKSLTSSAATHNDDQPTEPAQTAMNNWAGMTESFEDDTSLMLQSLDPTVFERFETQQPILDLNEVNKTATSSLSVSSNVGTHNAQYENHRANFLTPTNFRNASPVANLQTTTCQPPREFTTQSQQFAQERQLRTTATTCNMRTPLIHNTPSRGTFKKPAVAASIQPRGHLHFSPKKSLHHSTKINAIQKVYPQSHFDAEDEFGDLPLSTQDVRDLDSMVGLG